MIEDFDRNLFKKCRRYLDKSPVIFDIGAHKGYYTKFVLETIPDANCYLFEPNIELAENLHQYKNVYLLAVGEHNGYKSFYVPPEANDELSSLIKREIFEEIGYEIKQVPCTSIDSFCLLNKIDKIDFIKVDVEGAELDVLNGCPLMMADKKIKFIQIEYGGTYTDSGITFKQVIETATVFGYNVYELTGNTLLPVTLTNFIEDYRYAVFLLTYLQC